MLFQADGFNILFDVSEDVLEEWHHAGTISRIDAVFITHPHSDAMGGLARFRNILAEFGQPTVPLYAEQATIKRIELRFETQPYLQFRPFAVNKGIKLGNMSILPLRVEHTYLRTHPTVGYLIAADKKRVAYISDTGHIPAPTMHSIRGVDLLILDSALYTKKFPNHLNLQQALQIVEKVKPKRTLLTQIGVDWPPHTKAQRIVRKQNPAVGLAYDGMRVRL